MAEINFVKENVTLTTKRIPKESLPQDYIYPRNPSSLQLFFRIRYQTHQEVMCITETGRIIPWSTWTNDEYSFETFKSYHDLMKNNYEIFYCHLLYKLNKLGIESHNHKILISQIIDIVCETIKSNPTNNILQQQKVLPLAVTIVVRKSHLVPERVLILEASRLEFERENYGMVPAAKEWIDRVLNSEKVVTTTEKENCAICYEEIVEIGSVMPCDHVYHKNCIEEWLLRSHLCPLCRFEMPTES